MEEFKKEEKKEEDIIVGRKDQKDLECMALKGIGQQLTELAYPQMKNLNDMLKSLGYMIAPIPTNMTFEQM